MACVRAPSNRALHGVGLDTVDSSFLSSAIRFIRVVRHIGVSAGPGTTLDALRALELVGVEQRTDVRSALRSLLAQRHEQRELFDRAFDIFWSGALRSNATPALDDAAAHTEADQDSLAPRIAQALLREGFANQARDAHQVERSEHLLSFSPDEALRRKDFAKMTTAEMQLAEQALARLALPLPRPFSRRWYNSPRGARVDWRSTLRASMRSGGDAIALARKARARRRPPLVALCDISGSMDRYTRVFLHFLHALGAQGERVHVFLFGTQLTNVSRQLAHSDIDVALTDIAQRVGDWAGGTRIGASLREFNQNWSRRVLGQNASVLLLTDGLDRGDSELLSAQMRRLQQSSRTLIWLNPLLRYAGFEPKAGGIRAMLPYARMLPVHDLASIAQLVDALNRPHRSSAWK